MGDILTENLEEDHASDLPKDDSNKCQFWKWKKAGDYGEIKSHHF